MREGGKAELLSPAGSFEKMVAAVRYGADAVYLAGKRYGMRMASDNFDRDELEEAVRYCHSRGVKVYVTVNVMPHTPEYPELGDYLRFLEAVGADAAIVSDIGVVMMAREVTPGPPARYRMEPQDQPRIRCVPVDTDAHPAGLAALLLGLPGRNDPGAQRSAGRVQAAGGHRDSFRKTHLFRSLPGQRSDNLMTWNQVRQ